MLKSLSLINDYLILNILNMAIQITSKTSLDSQIIPNTYACSYVDSGFFSSKSGSKIVVNGIELIGFHNYETNRQIIEFLNEYTFARDDVYERMKSQSILKYVECISNLTFGDYSSIYEITFKQVKCYGGKFEDNGKEYIVSSFGLMKCNCHYFINMETNFGSITKELCLCDFRAICSAICSNILYYWKNRSILLMFSEEFVYKKQAVTERFGIIRW